VRAIIDMPLTLETAALESTGHSTPTFDEVAEHAPVLLAAARLLLRNEAEARDLVQTTCEIGMRRVGDLRDPERLLPWLLTIQTHEAFRLRRRLRRLLSVGDVAEAMPAAEHDDHQALVVREALRTLPARARTAVVLHHMVGLTVGETAAAMGVSLNTAKSHLERGLELLREELR
jgi:RNA polymerase sigma factor (sigma-70 family)